MKVIQHSVFAEAREWYPIMSLLFAAKIGGAQRTRNQERIRKQAEAFINEVGLGSVVSVAEHAPTLGPFSVVVWWHREVPDMPETETLVIRAAGDGKTV